MIDLNVMIPVFSCPGCVGKTWSILLFGENKIKKCKCVTGKRGKVIKMVENALKSGKVFTVEREKSEKI